MKTTVNTEPTPEELIKVRWISVSHETRSNRQGICGGYDAEWQERINVYMRSRRKAGEDIAIS